MADTLFWLITGLIVLAIVIAVLAHFYQRGDRETALVRTGLGGRRVALDGGVLALPWFNHVARVNMQTLRLEVKRSGASSLITSDKLRVDVGVEFYVSVTATEDAVSRAAQTLGSRTFEAGRLRDLIEGKLVDALRSAAARFTLDELHERRGDFVSQVRDSLQAPLDSNGLTLDSVSLTDMDQTSFDALDDNNAFNAAGMRKLSELIARARKERADIDADAEMAVRNSELTLTKRRLEIELEEEQARIQHTQRVEQLKAQQMAEIAAQKADSERAIAVSQLTMEEQIESARVQHDLELMRLEQQRQLEEHRTVMDESAVRIERAQIEARAIAAQAESDTTRAVSEAERQNRIAALEAEQAAQRREVAARAHQAELTAEAEGRRAMVDAENGMSDAVLKWRTEQARLAALPQVVGEMVKPAEKIDSIKIHQITGLTPAGSGGSSSESAPVNQIMESLLGMAVQLPTMRRLGEELGLSLDDNLQSLRGSSQPEGRERQE